MNQASPPDPPAVGAPDPGRRDASREATRAAARTQHLPREGLTIALAAEEQAAGASEHTVSLSRMRGDFTVQRERRIVTVLFADIAGFTAMTGRMDVEDLTSLLDRVFDIMARCIQDYGGIVDKFLGDAVMAVFGAPVAHEDDADRAVRAALQMKRELATMASDTGLPIAIGVGIHTGPVIAGAFGSESRADYTVIGDTVNLASRLEGLARPGQILMSRATRDRCLDACDPVALGDLAVKGKSEPIPVFEAAEPRPERRANQRASDLPPLVGRRAQLRKVRELLEKLRPIGQAGEEAADDAPEPGEQPAESRGGCLLFLGEVGVGKSRFALEVRDIARGMGYRVVHGASDSWNEGGPRGLVAQLLGDLLDLPYGDAGERRERLTESVRELVPETSDERLAVLARFLALEGENDERVKVSTGRIRDEIQDTLVALLRAQALRQPVVVLADNLQSAEEGSLAALSQLVGLTELLPLALIGLARTGREQVLTSALPQAEHVALTRLDVRASGQLAANLLGVVEVSPEFAALMAERTGGNPFFIEETVKDLISQGTVAAGQELPPIEELQIPSSVQEVILARIDRLDAATKMVLQVASVIGRTFRSDVLARVVGEDPGRLAEHLTQLEDRQFVFPLTVGGVAEYMFKHNVTRDVAYETLLRRNRSMLHEKIATVLEELLGDAIEDEVQTLAHHYLETDRNQKKGYYLVRAGQSDYRRGNFADAERYLLLADEVIGPRDPLRDKLDDLLARLYTQGGRYQEAIDRLTALIERCAVPDVRYSALVARGRNLHLIGDFARAEDDLRRVISVEVDDGIVSSAYRVLAILRRDQGRTGAALKYCHEALRLLEASDDAFARADAWMVYGDTLVAENEEEEALEAYQRARALFDRVGAKSKLAALYNNIGVRYRRNGNLGRAREYFQMCLEIAIDLGSWREIGNAQQNLGNVLTVCGMYDEAMAAYQEALRLCKQHGALREIAFVLMPIATVLRQQGQLREAQEACERGIQLFTEQGVTSVLPHAYSDLASLLIADGSPECLTRAEEVITKVEEMAETLAQPEYREAAKLRRAELSGVRGDIAEADRIYREVSAGRLADQGADDPVSPELAYDHAKLIAQLDPARALRYLTTAEEHARRLRAGGGGEVALQQVEELRNRLQQQGAG